MDIDLLISRLLDQLQDLDMRDALTYGCYEDNEAVARQSGKNEAYEDVASDLRHTLYEAGVFIGPRKYWGGW